MGAPISKNVHGVEKVVESCEFIKYCVDNASNLPEPLWHAMITNLAPLKGGNNAIHKFSESYPKHNFDETERKMYLGLLGELKEEEIKDLFAEVLTPLGYNLMVTPKEVDFLTDKISFAIAKSINNVLHNINE